MKIFQVNEQAMKEFDTSPQVILAAAQGAKLSVEQGVLNTQENQVNPSIFLSLSLQILSLEIRGFLKNLNF